MATYIWAEPGSGDFNVASNWTLNGVTASTAPGPGDEADFGTSSTDVGPPITGTISGNPDGPRIVIYNPASNLTFTGSNGVIHGIDIHGALTLPTGASITSSLGLAVATDPDTSGTFVVEPGASFYGAAQSPQGYFFNIGSSPNLPPLPPGTTVTGTAIVQGPGALVDMGPNVGASVGYQLGSTGSLKILAGGVAKFATANPGNFASLAVGRQGTGTVTVDGTGSQLQLSGWLLDGRAGTGTVTLTNGASLTETAVPNNSASTIGLGNVSGGVLINGGTGFLNVLSGSTATFADSLSFGTNGSTGVGLVSDGTLSVGGLIQVGTGTIAPGGKGTLTIDHGGIVRDTAASSASTAYVQLGAASGTTGTVSVDGWGSLLDGGANAIDVGTIGAGTLTASDHGVIKSTGVTVGDRGTGTLKLSSGADAIAKSPSGNGAALSVGAQAGGTGSVSVSGHGSALIAVGEAVLGGTDTGGGTTAGGTGDVSVSQGGLLGTGGMNIESGSSLGIDGKSAALIAGNLSDGGGITTSGLLAITGALSGAGSLTLDGGLADLGSLDSAKVHFGGAEAVLSVDALSGSTTVSGMQGGDVIDLVGQHGVKLKDDTVTTKTGMLFLSPAPAGDTYKLIHSRDGTAVVLTPASEHGKGDDVATADRSFSFASQDNVPNISADLLQSLGFTRGISSLSFTATDDTSGHLGAAAGNSLVSAAIDLLMTQQHLTN
jgi:autotransporter family porin